MMPFIKTIATATLATMFRPKLLSLFRQNPLTILMYHGVIDRPMVVPDPCMVPIDVFRLQMRYLKKHFRVVSLTTAIQLLQQDAVAEPTVVITFDDGYQNNYDLAYPVLQQESLPATIFVSTLFTDKDSTIWTGVLQNLFAQTAKTHFEWRGQRHELNTVAEKIESLNSIKSELKNDPHESLNKEVEKIVTALSEGDRISLSKDSPYRMLNSESISRLANSELIEFGGHTHSHFILSRLPASSQDTEIRKSLELVETFTGKPCDSFAYPNGKQCDYDDESLSILQRYGIKAALTTESGTCDHNTPNLELKRIGVSAEADMSSFKLSLFDIQGRLKSTIARITRVLRGRP